jgi:hypothetical protein
LRRKSCKYKVLLKGFVHHFFILKSETENGKSSKANLKKIALFQIRIHTAILDDFPTYRIHAFQLPEWKETKRQTTPAVGNAMRWD